MSSYGTLNKEQPAAGAPSKLLLVVAGLALFAAGAFAGSAGVGPKTMKLYKHDGEGPPTMVHPMGDPMEDPTVGAISPPNPGLDIGAISTPDTQIGAISTPDPVAPVTPTATTSDTGCVCPPAGTPAASTVATPATPAASTVATPATPATPALDEGMGMDEGEGMGMGEGMGEGMGMDGGMTYGGPDMGGRMNGGMGYRSMGYMAKDKSEAPKQPNLFLPALVLAAVAFALGWLSSMTYKNLVAAPARNTGMKAPLMVDPEA